MNRRTYYKNMIIEHDHDPHLFPYNLAMWHLSWFVKDQVRLPWQGNLWRCSWVSKHFIFLTSCHISLSLESLFPFLGFYSIFSNFFLPVNIYYNNSSQVANHSIVPKSCSFLSPKRNNLFQHFLHAFRQIFGFYLSWTIKCVRQGSWTKS